MKGWAMRGRVMRYWTGKSAARLILPLLWLGLVGLSGATLAAENRPIKAFYGQYIGHAISDAAIERNLSVTIGPTAKQGFFVSWTTVSHKKKGLKRKVYQVKFLPSERESIYSSAMRTNVFGGQVSLDPLNGDPFVWARIKGDTLTVHTLVIMEDGGYEMQIYNRTLNAQGLRLEYSRMRTGERMRQVSTQLVRVAD
jgi:hypothetical protein